MGARLGQHFLADPAAIETIVAAALPLERALEIGPGRGALTQALCACAREVLAVELDERLASKLTAPNLRVLQADFLRLDLSTLPGPWTIVANLPYAVGTPILQKLLPWDQWSTAVLMFQKEVAERVAREAGLLRLSVWMRADVEWILDVPKTSFRPPPKVDSAVVRLTRRAPRLDPAREKRLFDAARKAFSQRRKMLSNTLGLAGDTRRPEELSPEDWVALIDGGII